MSSVAVTLHSYFTGNPSNPYANVFGFDVTGGTVSDEDWVAFAEQWQLDVIALIRAVVGTETKFTSMSMRSLDGSQPDQYYDFTPELSGAIGGDALPQFCAWGFQYNRLNPPQRSGAKRFGYVAESSYNGVAPVSSAATNLPLLATALATPIVAGTLTWTPGIIHKTGPSTGVVVPIRSVTYKRMTSQNSRKR